MRVENIVACSYVSSNAKSFEGVEAATGNKLDGVFTVATEAEVDNALTSATTAFSTYKNISGHKKATFLREIAKQINIIGEQLVNRAVQESGLPLGRIQGELGRTTGQLNMFADLLAEGSWVDAVIDTAQLDRKPLPKSDIRRMLIPIGPVVVFGASNFPLAFSVAGGDTASALAAGCPVVVKAHPAHPGTSALVGEAIVNAAKSTGMPGGIFSLLYDDSYAVGSALVKHALTKAVTFTGSYKGGMALVKLAQERHEPIPVFAEMGSINPVLLLPAALDESAEAIANKYAVSITLGAGQFCTNPGLLIGVKSASLDVFKTALAAAIEQVAPATMLTKGICENYHNLSTQVLNEDGVSVLAESKLTNELANQSTAKVVEVSAAKFLSNPKLQEEIFGPYSLLVIADDEQQRLEVVKSLEGQLTVTLMAGGNELESYTELLSALQNITGRIILNGVPTGVEVCAAMQHGGPFPATNDSRFTSVGSTAVYRFVRPFAWQDWVNALLPDELKDGNPLNIWRKVDNTYTKD
ncbi:aldehyde dehydrogenase (NADP(+)) [Mucilaginibacter pallidiroseus]|uniref:Aldehyde dehydrogenase (NADP(+)) n=1 Tax=Mucilaginibacter pallidiroseus TaxID=2599295 RepID=A0A563U0P0_9SPHI|nr:aldehyde dehydrogenase (NADP(+)) [Mucilaginibacter pallidiroseus]TWR25113.1 aldehyde dehydrogenase (NADP(+)) [Mucilaginibacter pallidiroseus]